MTVSVVSSPTWVYIKIETWNSVVISPALVVITGAIPPAFPWTPPPTVPEKQVYIYVGNNVNSVCIRHHYHIRRCLKYDGWWQRNTNANIDPCHRCSRDDN
jgi:hypothetical protein